MQRRYHHTYVCLSCVGLSVLVEWYRLQWRPADIMVFGLLWLKIAKITQDLNSASVGHLGFVFFRYIKMQKKTKTKKQQQKKKKKQQHRIGFCIHKKTKTKNKKNKTKRKKKKKKSKKTTTKNNNLK